MEQRLSASIPAYPGPYHIATSTGEPMDPDVPDEFQLLLVAEDGTCICEVDMPYMHQALVPGTAILLAAAPALRQSLTQVVRSLERGEVPSPELVDSARQLLSGLPPEATIQELSDLG